MTFLQLQQAVYNRLDETYDSSDIWSLADVKGYINKGYNDFLFRTHLYIVYSDLTPPGGDDEYYNIPRDSIATNAITFNDRVLEILYPHEMGGKNVSEKWRSLDGDPKYAIMSLDNNSDTAMSFYLYPAIDSGLTSNIIRYYYIPYLTLTNDTDNTVIPYFYEEALILFAQAEALKKLGVEQDYQRAQILLNEYNRYVFDAIRYNNSVDNIGISDYTVLGGMSNGAQSI